MVSNDFNFWNQVNCPLYEDNSTWYVPGSFQRDSNTVKENELYASTTQEILRDETNEQTDEALELFCLQYCQAMPDAVQLVLNPGDFCVYRNVGWHIGNYVPYRKRMTIHTQCDTPEFVAFRNEYFHLLNAQPLRWKSTANCRSRKGPALGIGLAKKYRIPRPDLQKGVAACLVINAPPIF